MKPDPNRTLRQVIEDRIVTLKARRDEQIDWAETWDRNRHNPQQLIDWARTIQTLDEQINELGYLLAQEATN